MIAAALAGALNCGGALNIIEQIAEARIDEAVRNGEFDSLPGAGRPLHLDDDSDVPPELRIAYRIMKNAGMIPPEIELRRELMSVESLLTQAITPQARNDAWQRIEYLLNRIALSRGKPRDPRVEQAYYEELTSRIG